MAKDKTFNLRLDKEDRRMLDAVAKELSAPAATAIRILIKRAYDEIVGRRALGRVELDQKRG